MSAEQLIASALRIAKQDLEGARLLSSGTNRNAVYLLSQAAEKIIRATLTSEGKHAGIRHQLDLMVGMIPDENPLKPLLRAVEQLAAYATTFRYPTPTGRISAAPSTTEFNRMATAVEEALLAASKSFGVDLLNPDTPASLRGPIR